jgi:hypothetical protein
MHINETHDGDTMIVKFIEYLRARMKLVIRLSYLVLGLLMVHYGIFVDKSSAHTKMELLFFFWAAFGFIACVLIIFLSKWYGHVKWFGTDFRVMSPEDYYDD